MEEEAPIQQLTCEEALEPLDSGRRIGSCSYVWRDQYVYLKNRENESVNGLVYYMRCWERKCKATMVCRAVTLVPVSSTPHNHPPQTNEVLKLRFKYELLGTVHANPQETPSRIYDKLAADPRFKDIIRHSTFIKRKRLTNMISRVRLTLIPKTQKSRSSMKRTIATRSKKKADSHLGLQLVNEGDLIDENEKLDENVDYKVNEDGVSQEVEDHVFQENEDDMLEENENDMLQENEDNMLQGNENDVLKENENDQTMRQEEDRESNIIFPNSSNNNSHVGELKHVVYKLEEISRRLYAATLADTYEQFGKYIATLLRGLPTERAKRLMENIVSEVLSAKLGFEVRVQPTGREAIFAEPLPECFAYDSTDTESEDSENETTSNTEVYEKFSKTSKRDEHSSNISPLPDCSESYTEVPLKVNNKQRVDSSCEKTSSCKLAPKQYKQSNVPKVSNTMESAPPSSRSSDYSTEPSVDNERIGTFCEKTGSFKSTTKQQKKMNAPKVNNMTSASPSSRSSDHSTGLSADNESLMCCISTVETVNEETAQTFFKEDDSEDFKIPLERVSNEEVVQTQMVQSSPESLMSYVIRRDDNPLSKVKDAHFICACCNIYCHSSCDIRKHFSSTHPGQTLCFKVKEPSSKESETSASKNFQVHSPQRKTGPS